MSPDPAPGLAAPFRPKEGHHAPTGARARAARRRLAARRVGRAGRRRQLLQARLALPRRRLRVRLPTVRVLSLGAGKPDWKRMSAEERFWIRVEKTDGCWLWTGATSKNGYGQIVVDGRQIGAHCYAYTLLVGPIPEGSEIDHVCHNADPACPGGQCQHRRCIRPDHLEPVAHAVNVVRGSSPSARAYRSGVCRNGHPKTPENWELGHRRCRICNSQEVTRRQFETTTHCPQGHAYTDFAYINARGRRRCSACFPKKAAV